MPVPCAAPLPVSLSPCLPVSLSPCLPVSPSPRLPVSPSPRLPVSPSPRLPVSPSPSLLRHEDPNSTLRPATTSRDEPSMELSLAEIAILAVVQGIAEFLPVSSSGHLVILAALMADGDIEAFDVSEVNIVLHGGTLLSIVVFYFRRIVRLFREDRQLVRPLMIATIPAVVVGLGMKATGADAALSSPLLAGCLLPVTGAILIWASRHVGGETDCEALTYGQAFVIGLSQSLAILPGLSRSGTTISTGLRLGLTPIAAATFSFLMAIPVIGGACLLEIVSLAKDAALSDTLANTDHLRNLAIGAVIAYTVGLGSLWLLVRWLERGRFQYFAYWCIPVGFAVIIWQLMV